MTGKSKKPEPFVRMIVHCGDLEELGGSDVA